MSLTATPATAPYAPPLSDAVQWSEGMLLAPQHLQQSDLYWQQQLRYRLAAVTPCYWGVAELALDETKLPEGKVRIERLECVMPDGTPVVYPGSYKEPLELDVTALAQPDGVPVRISLLMPKRLAGAESGPAARHEVVNGDPIVDENGGFNAVPVDRLRPRILLWAGAERIPPQFQVCPLLEVQRRPGVQRFELGRYHPPLLRFGAADFLGAQGLPQRLRSLNRELWMKLRELGGDRRDDAAEDPSPLGGEAQYQLGMARRLATVLPRLGLLAARPEGATLPVYDLLAEVAGAMASFGANPIVPMFDVYRHDDCEPQFSRALEYIERKLAYIDTRHEWLPFERLANGQFSRKLGTVPSQGLIIELRSATSTAVTETERRDFALWLQNACIASEGEHAAARQARVSAKVRALKPEACTRLHLRSAAALFLIEPTSLGDQPLLVPDQVLLIDGMSTAGQPPAAVFLVQARTPAKPASNAGETR